MKLEEKLVSLRKAKGLSQMKLAEKMNVSRQAISRWETGAAIPSSENLKYLSDLYSVSLDYLLSDSADAPEQNRRISNEPDGEMVTISDSADGGKKGKQKTAKWLAIVMVVVALITVINCTYSPRTANLDFGFITQDDTFHFTSGSNGSIKTNIQIDKTGKYYFAVRNNENETVEVLGYVYY